MTFTQFAKSVTQICKNRDLFICKIGDPNSTDFPHLQNSVIQFANSSDSFQL